MKQILEVALETHENKIKLAIAEKEKECALRIDSIKREYEEQIEILEGRCDELKKENEKRNIVRWSPCKRYFNLSDFCRNMKGILFIKESNIKQHMEGEGILIKENEKYIPSPTTDDVPTAIMIDNELYIDYDYLRNIIALRSMIFVANKVDIDKFVARFERDRELITEKMGNTVYIACKQRSKEFASLKANNHYIGSGNVNLANANR